MIQKENHLSFIESMNMYRKVNGSITVEAAIIIPMFVFSFMALISINIMLSFKIKVHQALYEEARIISMEAFDTRSIAISSMEEDIREILNYLGANYSIIKGGENGINLSESKLDSTEYVELIASYNFVPFGISILDLVEIPIEQRCVMHIWCGYENGYFGLGNQDYVYVTDNSDVYHLNRECSHIKLSIKKVNANDISSLRNRDGGKYHSCEICHSKLSDDELYITSDGNRYHNTIICSGLKRTVRLVRITNIDGRRPCKRCGY